MIDSSVPTSEAFKKLQILTVSDMINLEQGKLGYKLCNGLLPSVRTQLELIDVALAFSVKHEEHTLVYIECEFIGSKPVS